MDISNPLVVSLLEMLGHSTACFSLVPCQDVCKSIYNGLIKACGLVDEL